MDQNNAQTYDEQGSEPQETCGLAVASLVLGIMGFCTWLITAIPAVI